MAGTLSATIAIGQAVNAAHAGNGALAVQIIERYAAAALLNGAGALDVASILGRFDRALALTGSGVLAPVPRQIYTAPATLAGSGALAALGTPSFARALSLLSDGVLSATAARYVPPNVIPDSGGGNVFRATGSATTVVASWSQTVAVDATLAIVGVNVSGGFSAAVTPSVDFGGVAMTLVGMQNVSSFVYNRVAIFKLKNPPTGVRTVTATGSFSSAQGNRGAGAWGQTYKNANADSVSVTTGSGGNNGTTPMTITTPAAVPVGGYGFYVFSRIPVSGSFTSYDGTQLSQVTVLQSYNLTLFGHKSGAGAPLASSAAHNAGSNNWGQICCGFGPLT